VINSWRSTKSFSYFEMVESPFENCLIFSFMQISNIILLLSRPRHEKHNATFIECKFFRTPTSKKLTVLWKMLQIKKTFSIIQMKSLAHWLSLETKKLGKNLGNFVHNCQNVIKLSLFSQVNSRELQWLRNLTLWQIMRKILMSLNSLSHTLFVFKKTKNKKY